MIIPWLDIGLEFHLTLYLKVLTKVFFSNGIFDADIWKFDIFSLQNFAKFDQIGIFFFVKSVIYKRKKVS